MIELRDMIMEDCERVAMIDHACFQEAWSVAMFEDTLRFPTYHYIVAVSEKEGIVGFAGIVISVDTADVMNIGVLPEYRKQGIGNMLMKKLENLAKISKCESIMLEVRESNQAAISLYQKNDFTSIAIRKNYYSNPVEHGIVMQKHL